jgi:hypothetical protein
MSLAQASFFHIKRSYTFYVGSAPYSVFVDDKLVGKLSNGKEAWFQVAAGRHIVQVRIAMLGVIASHSENLIVDIAPGEIIALECGLKWTMNTQNIYLKRSESIPDKKEQGGLQNRPNSEPQIVGEINTVEIIEVFLTEEFPLDNTHGTDVLSTEIEVSKTTSNQVHVERHIDIEASIGLEAWKVLTAKLSTKLSQQIGQTIGETRVRRQVLRFTVQPKHSVVYIVEWKRKVRTGSYVISHHGANLEIPYRVTYDLFHEVKTR